MSRMRLCLDSPLLPEGTVYDDPQPIYDFDFEQAVADGLSLSGANLNKILADNDNVSMCRFEISGVTLNQYLSTNMPRTPWDEGDVLRSRISPYVQDENDVYQPDPQYYNFQLVSETSDPQPAPDDWHDASNYFGRSLETVSGHTYERFYNIRKTEDWTAGSITYYKDVGRNAIKQYYTAAGYSFSVYRCGQGKSSSQEAPLRVAIGSDSMSSTQGTYSAKGYNFTNPTDGTLQYYTTTTDQGGSGSKQNVLGYSWSSNNWSSAKQVKVLEGTDPSLDGVNTTLVFISFRYEDPDPDHYQPDIWYYGIAMVDRNNWTERSIPTNISVIAFTSAFWGNSIINGGGGESVWGNDGPPAAPQGGNGSWNAPSDNHGDPDGTTATQTGALWGGHHSIFDIGYKKYILGSPDAAAFGQMVGRLSNPEDWGTGFSNKYYNPIQAIISCHMIPANLAPAHTGSGKIVAATVNLTDTNVPTFSTLYYSKHIGSVNLAEYTGSFADYNNTSIYINLPYIGVKQLDTAACMNGQVAVDYLIDYLTGDTTAWVWVEDRFGNHNIRYEWKGNIARPIPLTQRVPASTQFMSSLLPAVATAAGSIAVGGLVGAVGGAGSMLSWGLGTYGSVGEFLKGGAQGAISGFGEGISKAAGLLTKGGIGSMGIGAAVGSALNAGQQMTSSNANGGSVSSPVNTQCYLAISRPQWSAPSTYRKQFGYPSDISGIISETFHGFLSVRAIYIDNISATAEEKAEITNLMSAGVYVDDNFGPEEE